MRAARMLMLAGLSLAAAGATELRGEHFWLSVEQDGRIVPIGDHRVHLQRRPFAFVIRLASLDAVMLNASTRPALFDAARAGRPVGAVLPLEGTGVAEDLFNKDRTLFVTDDGYHFLHYYGPRNHRFDEVTERDGRYVCRRTVARFRTPEMSAPTDIGRVPGGTLYCVFVKTAWTRPDRRRVARQTERLRIDFD